MRCDREREEWQRQRNEYWDHLFSSYSLLNRSPRGWYPWVIIMVNHDNNLPCVRSSWSIWWWGVESCMVKVNDVYCNTIIIRSYTYQYLLCDTSITYFILVKLKWIHTDSYWLRWIHINIKMYSYGFIHHVLISLEIIQKIGI